MCCAAACNGGETVTLGAAPVTISVVNYTGNMKCTWAISGVPPIELTVTSLDTEAGNDFVKVYDGQKMLGQYTGSARHYTGSVLPPPLRVMDATIMTVTFASDSSGNAKGFVAVLRTIPGAPLPCFPFAPRAAASALSGASVRSHGPGRLHRGSHALQPQLQPRPTSATRGRRRNATVSHTPQRRTG